MNKIPTTQENVTALSNPWKARLRTITIPKNEQKKEVVKRCMSCTFFILRCRGLSSSFDNLDIIHLAISWILFILRCRWPLSPCDILELSSSCDVVHGISQPWWIAFGKRHLGWYQSSSPGERKLPRPSAKTSTVSCMIVLESISIRWNLRLLSCNPHDLIIGRETRFCK